jgi:glycogen operon protein
VAGPFQIGPGENLPPGAHRTGRGVNFSVFSRYAQKVWLILYDSADAVEPLIELELDSAQHRTFYFWHVLVQDLPAGVTYTWRMSGPAGDREIGHLFTPARQLLDPWATQVSARHWDRAAAIRGDGAALRGVVPAADDYDWEGDQPLNHALEDSVIYEVHVGTFTKSPTAGVAAPGTFRGLKEKIPYLKQLGITDVELLPVMAFDQQDVPPGTAALGLENVWGYSPYGFYALHPGFVDSDDPRREFRDLVKALHREGIGVILDVVFNHTAEGGADGPTIHFRGIGNETFYHLDAKDRRVYRDFTGCGNTLNCNHPVVASFLLQCLEFWVREMHVDGFRLDLASVLARGEDGQPMEHPPVLWSIEFSSTLARTRLIAEAWDAAGLYQLGNFPGFRWAEWNGDYRDVVRRFVRGEEGLVAQLASRIGGSSDLFGDGGLPVNSINFITCHDGFALHDLVSYNGKHNEANGEDNRDGINENYSWNCGIEGPTADPSVTALRRRQARNFMAILLLSQGAPMLLAGDEVLRSQNGNNNAYCQDNATSWFDWSRLTSEHDMLRFTREMIALRRRHPSLRRRRFLTGADGSGLRGLPDIRWHGSALDCPGWKDQGSRCLAFTLAAREPEEPELHVMMNMHAEAVSMMVPSVAGRDWWRAVDTAQPPPQDIAPPHEQLRARGNSYAVAGRSVVVLEARVSRPA